MRGSSGYYACLLVRMCFKVRFPLSGAEPREHKKGEPRSDGNSYIPRLDTLILPTWTDAEK